MLATFALSICLTASPTTCKMVPISPRMAAGQCGKAYAVSTPIFDPDPDATKRVSQAAISTVYCPAR